MLLLTGALLTWPTQLRTFPLIRQEGAGSAQLVHPAWNGGCSPGWGKSLSTRSPGFLAESLWGLCLCCACRAGEKPSTATTRPSAALQEAGVCWLGHELHRESPGLAHEVCTHVCSSNRLMIARPFTVLLARSQSTDS